MALQQGEYRNIATGANANMTLTDGARRPCIGDRRPLGACVALCAVLAAARQVSATVMEPIILNFIRRRQRDFYRDYRRSALTAATSAPGLGSPLPHLHRDSARRCHVVHRTRPAPLA